MFNDNASIVEFLRRGVEDVAVLVVGDVMLDRYYFGEVKRISPEAPVPVTRVTNEHATLGGAGNVANNLASIGCRVALAGMAGEDEARQRLDRLLAAAGIDGGGLVGDGRPTTTKLRVLGGHQQMIRLDFEDSRAAGRKAETSLKAVVSAALGERKAQAVVISDYAKGVCTPGLCQHIVRECASHAVPLVVDPKGADWRKYSGAPYITPNVKELGEAAKTEAVNDDRVVKMLADKVRKRYNIASIVVTRSEKGLSVICDEHDIHISTYAQEVFDVSGAGDTVVAVLAAALAAKVELIDAAHLANLAAGVVVGKLGTYAIKRDELLAAVGRETALPNKEEDT